MVVATLTKKLPGWQEGKYHVFLDNLFTSEKLLSYCYTQRIGCTGTARKNSGMHQDLVDLFDEEKKKGNPLYKWGTLRAEYVHNGQISQAAWKDNSVV